MQKIIKYILAITLLVSIISGCSVQNGTPDTPIPSRFESDFSANFGKLEISGNIVKLETGIYTFKLTAPKNLEGISFEYIGDKTTVSFNGISFVTNNEELPVTNFIKSVTNSLDTLSNSSGVTITKSDGYNKHYASSKTGEFYILQEQNSGNIVSLVIEAADISMNFSNFYSK